MATAFATNVPDPQTNVRGEFVQIVQLLATAAAGVYTISVPAGCLIQEVSAVITEAFNGTAPLIKIGDPDDDDGYLTSAIIAPATALTTTAPAVKRSYSATSATAFEFGKYYPTASTINVDYALTTASTTGKCIIVVKGIRVDRHGVPAGLLNTAVL